MNIRETIRLYQLKPK